MERRLAAILAADVVGYSKLMGIDETGTLTRLKALRSGIVEPEIKSFNGRVFKLMGDGLFAEFPSVVDAIQCAAELQEKLRSFEDSRPADDRIKIRIGVNLGDIIIEGTDVYGDGVNVAARIESLAEPGGVCVSRAAHDAAEGKTPLKFEDVGAVELKNIAKPVHIFKLVQLRVQETAASNGETVVVSDKPSIAVLPFDNMSGDPDQEYFADGVVEALTAALSRVRSFFVIARNSAFTYKGRATNVRDIRRDLGVAYILEGSVQRSGERVRITVQLIETDGGSHIWADKYDGSVNDIFDLQDSITEQVTGALQPSLRLAEIERTSRKRPQDLGAYDYTMRAFRHVWSLEKEEAKRALVLLDQALTKDPDYPLALALAAWCHAQSSVYNWVENVDEAKAKALDYAERAASISADDPLILSVLGAVHTFARNFGAARVLLERAVALDPNAAWAWSRLGWLAAYGDRPDEARAHFEKAMRLSPVDPANFNNYVGIGSSYLVESNDEKTVEYFQRALSERPNAHWLHRNIAPALLGIGRPEEAAKSYAILQSEYPNFTIESFREAMVFSKPVMDRVAEQLRALGVPEK